MKNLASSVCDENTLFEMIDRVEASADGETAVIIGTRKAIQHLTSSIIISYKNEADIIIDVKDIDYGYVGKFYGRPMIVASQSSESSTEFPISDDVLTVVAGNSMVSVVYDKSIAFESSKTVGRISNGDILDSTKK